MGIGAPELLIVLLALVQFVALVVAIIVLVDVTKRSDAAWQAIGQSKTVWIVLPIVLLVACGIGSLIASIVYLTSVKPKLVVTGY